MFFLTQLPILCSFQSVNYTVTISHDGDPVLEWRKEFSYSSGYSSECVEEMVTGGLEEGSVYTVQVFVEAGDSGNASSDVEMLTISEFVLTCHDHYKHI